MNVLLVITPFLPFNLRTTHDKSGLALGVAYLAAAVEEQGIPVEVLDLNLPHCGTLDALEEKLVKRRPDVVGVSAMSINHPLALKIARRVKALDHRILTVMGGIHPTLRYEDMLADPAVDYVVLGEGERSFPELLAALDAGRDPATVRGVALGGRAGAPVTVSARLDPDDLDALPWPARHLFDMTFYTRDGTAKMITSRGCPYRCAFCSTSTFHGKKLRTVSARRVVDEMAWLINTYHVKGISFADDIFTLNRRRTEEICHEILARGIKTKWGCSTRVDQVDPKLLELMRAAGCQSIFYGIESLTQSTLDRIRKGFTVEQAMQAVRWTKAAGIGPIEAFIIGLPGDTRSDVLRVAEFLKETDPQYMVLSILVPYPGTLLAGHLEEFGIRQLGNMSLGDFVVPMIETPDLSWPEIVQLRVDVDSAACDYVLHTIGLPRVTIGGSGE